jgi:hypothetical protein
MKRVFLFTGCSHDCRIRRGKRCGSKKEAFKYEDKIGVMG